MSNKEDDFRKRLLAAFQVEAGEHVEAMSSGLLDLEKPPPPEQEAAIVETIYREAHSLKGAARAVDKTDIEAVCQSLEDLFAAMKRQEVSASAGLFDTLHQVVDGIRELLASPGAGAALVPRLMQQIDSLKAGAVQDDGGPRDSAPPSHEAPPSRPSVAGVGRDEGAGKAEKGPDEDPPAAPAPKPQVPLPPDVPLAAERPAFSQTVRIPTERLDALLRQAEEMLSAKLTTEQRTADLLLVRSAVDLWAQEWTTVAQEAQRTAQLTEGGGKRGEGSKADPQRSKLLEFFDQGQGRLGTIQGTLAALAGRAEQDYRSLGGMVDNLLEDMKNALMLPFSSLLDVFPKMVRDIARDQGKEVELVIEGGEVEIDKRILEEMKAPLIHLVRNSIDHGIESPAEREANEKPRRGTHTIAVSQVSGSELQILVSDDGAGMDLAKITETAVERGIVSQEEAEHLGPDKARALVFRSGLSTSPMITDLSGRGLGLAIVREKVDNLGGRLSLETAPGAGTTFRILLPVTLATFRGILVQAGERDFVIPTISVERVARIERASVKTVENKEAIAFNGHAVSLVRLDDVLELPRAGADGREFLQVLILGKGEERIAFSVDEIRNEQEVLVKGLGRQLSRVRNVGGATVLGSGQVVPILNVSDLMKSAAKASPAPARAGDAASEESETRQSVLVVEDSITSRMLLQTILESAGYHVETAVDGVDGFAALRTRDFDLLVSDIEMPRMDGFDLTAKIRGDDKLADLPVVLVTSLDSREHRERGIDAGANAYIVKSSFDQSNLLETVQRLI